jgi:hypothetical protein
MDRVWVEISPSSSWQLGRTNMLLIDDNPYKCIGNAPLFYIMPNQFDNEVEDNCLLEELWPYLACLFKAPSTLKYRSFQST